VRSGELEGFGLDWPSVDDVGGRVRGSTYDLDFAGWALGRRRPLRGVHLGDSVVSRRFALDRARPDVEAANPELPHARASGFAGSLSMLSFPPEFELTLSALLDDDEHVDLARVRGRRAPLATSCEPSLQPAIVTTMGRSGSTVLVRVLAAHERIVAFRPLDYEPRVASYWIEIMRALAEPASYRLQLEHGSGAPGWWLGTEDRVRLRRGDADALDWLGSEGVETLAAFCQSRIDAFYARIARREGRDDAAYFAEKVFLPGVAPLMRELYTGAREIVLVRDFRDMIASMLAYDAKLGGRGLDAVEIASESDYVRRVARSAERFRRVWERVAERSLLVRYEDLILRPLETVEAIVDYLELDAAGSVRERMVETIFEDRREVERHRTTRARELSIGRWREDLDAELQRVCQEALAPALAAFFRD
jgi:hypothetical protein